MYEEYDLYVYGEDNNSWLIEHCLICSSVNHIFLCHPNADAWECYNCFSKWWLNDDLGKEGYKIVHGKTDAEAEQDLKGGNMIFLNGQAER
jgi:hypothetical protein